MSGCPVHGADREVSRGGVPGGHVAGRTCLGSEPAAWSRPARLRHWSKRLEADPLHGRTSQRGEQRVVSEPLIRAPAAGGNLISFNNLVEAHVLRALRTRDGVRMTAVRKAIDYAEKELGIKRKTRSRL